jgi:hypothetical protein
MYHVSLTRVSRNEKTGPIPVSTTSSGTCPKDCAQYNTCYAKYGPLANHWKLVDAERRGLGWDDFCDEVHRLPRKQLWRHNQAGDLPGDGVNIDSDALYQLVMANKGKRGFTYTHYSTTADNLALIEAANAHGFTVNISCDTLTQSDRVSAMTNAPQAVVLHSDEKRKSFRTPAGKKVLVCPATWRDDINCANCQICQDRSPNRAVIGFPAHGTKKKVINLRLERT